MKKKILDSWKRPAEIEVFDTGRIPQQTELQLNMTREATPEEHKEWIEKELLPLGDIQLKFVAMMSVIQIATLGFMLLSFWLIGHFATGE